MRLAPFVAVLLLLPLAAAVVPPVTSPLEVELRLVGYDDGIAYAPHLTEESVLGTGIYAASAPACDPAAPGSCGAALLPAGQWMWAELRALRADGSPAAGFRGWVDSPESTHFVRLDERGEARALVRPAASFASFSLRVSLYDPETAEDWYGVMTWRSGAEMEGATRERVFGPEDAWENLTLDVVGPGFLVFDVVFGSTRASAPRDAAAALVHMNLTFPDGGWFAVGSAFVGAMEPLAAVVVGDDPELGVTVRGSDPVGLRGGGGVGAEAHVEPGDFHMDLTLARAGLQGDDGWALRVFADPSVYQVTRGVERPFRVAPLEFKGVEARAIIFGPHSGTYRAALDVDTHEPSYVMLGASTNPFTEGDVTLRHDGRHARVFSEGVGGNGVGLWNSAQGDCAGRWSAEARVLHGVASAYVGAAIAEGLVLPPWRAHTDPRLACA